MRTYGTWFLPIDLKDVLGAEMDIVCEENVQKEPRIMDEILVTE